MDSEIMQRNLPNGWEWATLKEISVPATNANKNTENNSDTFNYIDIEAIDNEKFEIKDVKNYYWDKAPSRAQQIVKTNDVLFSNVRPYLKNIAVVPTKLNGQIASTGFCIIRPFIINPKYIFYYVTSKAFIEKVNSLAKGTSYPAVTNEIVLSQNIPIPPLKDQDLIVERIEALFDEVNQAEASFKKILLQLRTYKQVILQNAFDGGLTKLWRETNKSISSVKYLNEVAAKRKKAIYTLMEQGKKVPKKKINYDFSFEKSPYIQTWAAAKLDKLIEIAARVGWKGLKKEEYTKDGPLFLSVHSLNYGKYVEFKDAFHISDERYNESREIKLAVNDVLLCKDGAGIGKVGIVKYLPREATINSSLLIVRSNEIFIPDFLYYLFTGPHLQKIVNERISGSAIPHLFQKDIREFILQIPPIEEQKQIVQEIEYRFTIADSLEQTIISNQKKIKVFRERILRNAFEGILVDSASVNETAASLLERIKKERATFLINEKQIKNNKPAIKKTMKEQKSILDILKTSDTPVPAEEVWLQSVHKDNIEGFYAALKLIQNEVNSVKKGAQSLLSLKNENR